MPQDIHDLMERLVRIETKIDAMLDKNEDHEDRIRTLEASRWKIAGGLLVAAPIITALANRAIPHVWP